MTIHHSIWGILDGIRQRRSLSALLRTTPPGNSILSHPPERLKSRSIQAIALDFDGVLAPHGYDAPIQEAEEWLKCCAAVFGEERLFILSNKPTDARRSWFTGKFPGIRFISGVRKKPYPDGLNKIAEISGLPLSAILMVDDRLLTGCLAAINAGAQPCYIRRPYISFRRRPFTELFFMMLRAGERLFAGLAS